MSTDIKVTSHKALVKSFKDLRKKHNNFPVQKIAKISHANAKRADKLHPGVKHRGVSASYIYHIMSKTQVSNRPLTKKAMGEIARSMNLSAKEIRDWVKDITPKDKFQPLLIKNLDHYSKTGHFTNEEHTPSEHKASKTSNRTSHRSKAKKTSMTKGSIDNALIVRRIKVLMKTKGMSANQLAKASNWDSSQFKDFLAGKTDLNTFNLPAMKIIPIAKALGTGVPSILEEPAKPKATKKPARKAKRSSKRATKSRTPAKRAKSHKVNRNHNTMSINERGLAVTVAVNARNIMGKERLSMNKLSQKTGWSRYYVKKMLSGERKINSHNGRTLAKALGTTPHALTKTVKKVQERVHMLKHPNEDRAKTRRAMRKSTRASQTGAKTNKTTADFSNYKQLDLRNHKSPKTIHAKESNRSAHKVAGQVENSNNSSKRSSRRSNQAKRRRSTKNNTAKSTSRKVSRNNNGAKGAQTILEHLAKLNPKVVALADEINQLDFSDIDAISLIVDSLLDKHNKLNHK